MSRSLLAFLGIPVCGAILAYALVYLFWLWLGGEPPTVGRLLGVAIFGGLSLIVVLVALRAWRRDREAGVRMGGWVLIPVLLVGGAGAGSILAAIHGNDRIAVVAAHDRDNCGLLLEDGVSGDALDECVAIARDCRQENADVQPAMGWQPEGLPPGVEPWNATQALELECIQRRR